jgi:DNA helicase-2/ATP-dependent DNA helicase PcrA
MLPFISRPSQFEILRYRGGGLGIAAVPGAGKTFTLSALAAQIIQSGMLGNEQYFLIVSMFNSVVDKFEQLGNLLQPFQQVLLTTDNIGE